MSRQQTSRILFVSGFSPETRAKNLAEQFEKFGPLVRCDVPATRRPTNSPYAFVEFKDEKDAEDAYNQMHSAVVGGATISVQWARRPPSNIWRTEPPVPGAGGDRDRPRDDFRDRDRGNDRDRPYDRNRGYDRDRGNDRDTRDRGFDRDRGYDRDRGFDRDRRRREYSPRRDDRDRDYKRDRERGDDRDKDRDTDRRPRRSPPPRDRRDDRDRDRARTPPRDSKPVPVDEPMHKQLTPPYDN